MLRTEYLYNEKYGFARSLGTRIRHGFFFNEFFDALEDSGLCANIIGQGYVDMIPPELDRFGIVAGSEINKMKLDNALLTLTRGILSTIENFRDGEISMRRHDCLNEVSDSLQPVRYFSFESLEDVSSKNFIDKDLKPEEIFDWGCAILKNAVEDSLANARNGLIRDFKKRLTNNVDEFEALVIELRLPTSSEQLLVARARNLAGNLIAKCNLVSNWFKIAETEAIENATLVDVLNAVAKSAQARRENSPVVQVEADRPINWRQVDILFIVIYNLSDNARKASVKHDSEVRLYTKKTSKGLEVGCRNRLVSVKDAQRAVDVISSRISSCESVEMMDLGGTGLVRARDLLIELDGLVEGLSTYNEQEWITVRFIIQEEIKK